MKPLYKVGDRVVRKFLDEKRAGVIVKVTNTRPRYDGKSYPQYSIKFDDTGEIEHYILEVGIELEKK